MHNLVKLIGVIFLGLSAALCSAQSDFELGVQYFDKRAENHDGLKVDSANINMAIKHFRKSIEAGVKEERSTDYMLLCYYYKAAFVVRTKKWQKKNYLIGRTLGERAYKKYPKNKGILLWYIAHVSKYGEAQGIIASAKNGLADKIKTLTRQLMELDPKFSDGSPHRIMGVINYKVPYIPLFLTWPSKEVAEEHLKKALAVNPNAIANLYYYAEFLVEEKRNAEAKVILTRLLKIAPRKDALIEDLYDISMAKKLLNQIAN